MASSRVHVVEFVVVIFKDLTFDQSIVQPGSNLVGYGRLESGNVLSFGSPWF